jgi:uncharacterized repeat protein (TIGR04076 family)
MYNIKVTVKSIKGQCAAGCKLGDVFYYSDGSIYVDNISTRLCAYGISAIHPYLSAFCRQTNEEDWINSLKELQCPDAVNCVTYQLERLK